MSEQNEGRGTEAEAFLRRQADNIVDMMAEWFDVKPDELSKGGASNVIYRRLLRLQAIRASSRGEPVAWQRKLRKRGSPDWSDWKECTKKQADYADAYGHPEDFEEVEAIARPLYASPAEAVGTDDLLEALKEAIAGYEECSQYKGDYLREKHGDDEEIAALKAVVAKATGAL